MNLQSTLDIFAGGAGSGCRGPNCGRPSGTGDRVDYLQKKIGGQKGSNPGGMYRGSDGVDRYVKFYSSPAQGRGEALANTIYNDLGIKAPKSTIIEVNGKQAFASEIVRDREGTLEDVGNKTKYADKILDGFAADVLVGNWDVVGLTYDNILIDKQGDVHRIDNGGSFLSRAQGTPKPESVLNKITEYDGLFNPSVNHEFASLMKKAGYSSADELGGRIKTQVDRIANLQKKYGGWDNYVAEKAPYITGKEKSKIVDMLDSRTELLRKRVSGIHAGGVGSGCHGDNCGRPPLGHNESGSETILGKTISPLAGKDIQGLKDWFKHPAVFKTAEQLGKWQSEHPGKEMQAERASDAGSLARTIADDVERGDAGQVFVVHSGDKPVGVIELRPTRDGWTLEVDRLAVHPAIIMGEEKYKGVGTSLMIKAAKEAARQGKGVSLYALEGARSFYAQLGMRKSMHSTYSWTPSQAKAFAEYGDKIAAMSRDEVEMRIRQAMELEAKNPILIDKKKDVKASAIGDVNCFIRKEGSQHCVKSHSGKNLGCYPSKGGAKKRLAQVEYFKHLKGGGEGSGCHGENCGRKSRSGHDVEEGENFGGWKRTYKTSQGDVSVSKYKPITRGSGSAYVVRHPDGTEKRFKLGMGPDVGQKVANYVKKHFGVEDDDLTMPIKKVQAGGPGSGRKPGGGKTYSDLNPVKQHERARLNPNQKSIFGPGHTKEIVSHPDQVKKSVRQQVKSLQFDEGGEPMVGNMARNTRTETNDWFDPTRRRSDKNTTAISSGGAGSGCHGSNCGRPESGGKSSGSGKTSFGKIKTTKDVISMVKKLGAKKMVHEDYLDAKSDWTDCRSFGERCGHVPALAKAYEAMGLQPKHLEQYADLMSSWTGASNKKFAAIAQDVLAGRLKQPMARAMAVDWAITQLNIKEKEVQLFRGVEGKYAHDILKNALASTDIEITVKTRGADSWADSRSEAEGFGNLILSQRVPKQYIISTWKTNDELLGMGEREFIVAYPKGKIPLKRSGIQVDLDSAGVDVKKKTVVVDLTDDRNANWLHNKTRRALKGMGEPDIPDFGTSYMDPIHTFHPPSLKNPDHVPADDPKETSDKFLDVTKRKEAQKMRGDLLRRARPGGNPPLIPIGTTAMNNPAGVSNPIVMMSQAQKPKRIIQRPAKPLGGKRTSIPLGRSY